jgi:signal transduction histidine kinase
MSRLWVRLSLAFAVVVIIATTVIGLTFRLATQVLTDPAEARPPEVVAYLKRVEAERRLGRPITVIVIVGLVAVGAGVWMSRRLTAPLAELEDAAQAIGRHEFGHRVATRGSQETMAAAAAFNEMASELERSEALRRNLLADVAHELRHPVHVLQGSLQAMLDGAYPLSEEEIARLYDQTQHLAALVSDLHVLAQAEARQLPLHLQVTDIGTFVKETVTAFRPLAEAKEVALRVELLGTMPELSLDPVRVRQAIHNLLDNALRHTPAGGDIIVSVEQIGDELQLRVEDTGEGIAPEQLPHVFDRFYRTDEARGRRAEGAGLGLAIARAFVEAHGGSVTASSPGLGHGSTFTVHLWRGCTDGDLPARLGEAGASGVR